MTDVSCAIIRNEDGKVLVVQHGENSAHPLKWEFPGGKIRPGESSEECVVREIDEELSLDIVICDSLTPSVHDYGFRKIRLIPFVCDTLMDVPVLHEHNAYRWIESSELAEIDFTGADIPVADEYHKKFGVDNHEENHDNKQVDSAFNDEAIKEMLGGKAGFASVDLIAESVPGNPGILDLLMAYARGEDKTLAFRAAYAIQKVAEDAGDEIIRPCHGSIIRALPSLTNESVIRSFLKIINLSGVGHLDPGLHGILADCCFNWLNSSGSAVAVKAYSMEALYNLSLLYPELASELAASIKHNMEEGSAGIKARGRQILHKLVK